MVIAQFPKENEEMVLKNKVMQPLEMMLFSVSFYFFGFVEVSLVELDFEI